MQAKEPTSLETLDQRGVCGASELWSCRGKCPGERPVWRRGGGVWGPGPGPGPGPGLGSVGET